MDYIYFSETGLIDITHLIMFFVSSFHFWHIYLLHYIIKELCQLWSIKKLQMTISVRIVLTPFETGYAKSHWTLYVCLR